MSGRCLVTGGAGFIGSHLVDMLNAKGHSVRVFDDFSTGQRQNLTHLPNVEIVEGTVSDLQAIARAAAGCEVIYHLAALASVTKSVENPIASHDVCGTGTLNVLQAARQAGVRRVVYAGSASAYGGASDPEGQDEDTPLVALSPYAAAKLTGEFYCQAFASTYGLETVRLRFFNVFGPRQRADSPYSGVIALFTAALTAGRTPTVFGDGLQSRDFTHVSDVVQAMQKAADAPGASGNVYNVGMGQTVTIREMVTYLNGILGTELEPIYVPARTGDVKFSKADIRRTRADLGYEPNVEFEEGLARTVMWYQRSMRRVRAGRG